MARKKLPPNTVPQPEDPMSLMLGGRPAETPERQDDIATGGRVDTSPQRQDAETAPPIRMAFYLSPDLVAALEERYTSNRAAARAAGEPDMRRVSRSAIVEEALRKFLES